MKNWLRMPANILLLVLVLFFLLRLFFQPQLNLHEGQLIKITGIIAQNPQSSPKTQILQLGQIKVITSRYPEYEIGDRLSITGQIQVKPLINIKTLGDRLPQYLMVYPQVTKVSHVTNSGIFGLADKLNNRLVATFLGLPAPLDGLAVGIVLGDKSLLPKETKDHMINIGIYHLAVASGMNVALLAQGFLGLLAWRINRRKALVATIMLIWLYVLVAGLSAPLMRAAIMVSLIYIAQIIGRTTSSGRILILTGLTMLVIGPTLLFSVSFQLSFMATAGLVYLQPVIKRIRALRNETLSGTLAAQILTLPIITGVFGQYNLLSPIVNLSVIPLMPFVLGGRFNNRTDWFSVYEFRNYAVLSAFSDTFCCFANDNLVCQVNYFSSTDYIFPMVGVDRVLWDSRMGNKEKFKNHCKFMIKFTV